MSSYFILSFFFPSPFFFISFFKNLFLLCMGLSEGKKSDEALYYWVEITENSMITTEGMRYYFSLVTLAQYK